MADERGFTLVELLLAALITVVALGAGATLLLGMERQSSSSSNRSEALQTLDTDMQRITSQVRQAVMPTHAAPGYGEAVNLSNLGTGAALGGASAYSQLSFYTYRGVGSANAVDLVTYECTTAANPSCYVNATACSSSACSAPPTFSASSSSWALALGCPNGADTTDSIGACAGLTSGYIFENGLSAGSAAWSGASASAFSTAGNFPVTIALAAQVRQDAHSGQVNTVQLVQTVTPQTESCQVIQCG